MKNINKGAGVGMMFMTEGFPFFIVFYMVLSLPWWLANCEFCHAFSQALEWPLLQRTESLFC